MGDDERWVEQQRRAAVEALWWALCGDGARLDEAFARFEHARRILTGELVPVERHRWWSSLAPFLVVQEYDRDGGHSRPRFRLELRSDTPTELVDAALLLEAPCCECGKPIRPFRQRAGSAARDGVYLAVACPLSVSLPCSRGLAAREAYHRLRAAIEQHEPAPRAQLGLLFSTERGRG